MNAKEAVSLALKQNPEGLPLGGRGTKSIHSEASRIRWPDVVRHYNLNALQSALSSLMGEQLVFVKSHNQRYFHTINTYFWDPEKSQEQFREFIEFQSRINSCNEKLKGHGFKGFNLRKTSPLKWLKMSNRERQSLLNVEIPLSELEEFVHELRVRISKL